MIMPVHVIMQFLNEMLNGIELLNVRELGFENAKEVLLNGIVQTVSFSRHALLDIVCLEYALIRFHLVMPALIGMKDKCVLLRQPFHRLIE